MNVVLVRLISAGAIVAMAVITACGSDYGDNSSDGDFGSRCFANNTCNTGLVCVQSVCLHDTTEEGGAPEPTAKEDGAAPGADGSSDVESGVFDEAEPPTFDSGPTTDGCAKGQDGDQCIANDACCSTHCNEARHCVSTCKFVGTPCTLGSSDECCIGSWCGSLKCSPCLPKGDQAAKLDNIFLANSCCSRVLGSGGVCQ